MAVSLLTPSIRVLINRGLLIGREVWAGVDAARGLGVTGGVCILAGAIVAVTVLVEEEVGSADMAEMLFSDSFSRKLTNNSEKV